MENNQNQNDQNRSWEDNFAKSNYDSTAPRNSSDSWGSQPFKNKLPADNAAMVLAIIATVVTVICCCFYGSFLGVVLSTIGFILAYNSVKQYSQAPDNYDPNSYRRVNNAKTFNLVIGIVSLLLSILMITGIASTYGKEFGYYNDFDDDYDDHYEDYDEEVIEEEPTDTWYYEEESDSTEIEVSSEEIEEQKPFENTSIEDE